MSDFAEYQPKAAKRTGVKLDPDPFSCPVRSIGHKHQSFFYLNPAGELIELSASAHKRPNIEGLFLGNAEWLVSCFPSYSKEGLPTGSWSEPKARLWLMQACRCKGIFDPTGPRRGVGVWRGSDGNLIVHTGDYLLTPGKRNWSAAPAGVQIGRALYLAGPPEPRPATRAATAEDAAGLVAALQLWKWKDRAALILLVGWIGQAMLGAAIEWRAHFFLVGPHGCGKTSLLALVRIVLGGAARDVLNNTTEAGLRQILSGEARPILIDEQEASAGNGSRADQIVELVRQMSSRDGVASVRGSPEGKARGERAVAAVCMAAINPPTLKPQDRSRFTIAELARLSSGERSIGLEDEVAKGTKQLARISSGLRTRMLWNLDRFIEAMAIYRSALLAEDCQPRVADQYSTLLAGAFVLTSNGLPSQDRVADEIALCATVLAHAKEVDEEEGEGHECLAHLLTSSDSASPSGQKNLGELIAAIIAQGDAPSEERLARNGCRIEAHPSGTRWLVVANIHAGLERIFRETRWSQKRWRTALRQLPDVAASASLPALCFAGARQRGTWIPLRYVTTAGEAETTDYVE